MAPHERNRVLSGHLAWGNFTLGNYLGPCATG